MLAIDTKAGRIISTEDCTIDPSTKNKKQKKKNISNYTTIHQKEYQIQTIGNRLDIVNLLQVICTNEKAEWLFVNVSKDIVVCKFPDKKVGMHFKAARAKTNFSHR